MSQDRVRLNNLRRQAEQRFSELEQDSPEIPELLEALGRLADDRDFWLNQSRGLALFGPAKGDGAQPFRVFRLPYAPEEGTTVGSRFVLRPLWTLMNRDQSLLPARSQPQERSTVRRPPRGVDRDRAAWGAEILRRGPWLRSVRLERPGSQQQLRGLRARPRSFTVTVIPTREKLHKDIEHYFRIVSNEIAPFLEDPAAPLVLATVEANVPLYRRANRHHELLEGAIHGNPDKASAHQLALAAEDPLESWHRAREADVLVRFAERAGQGRTSLELPTIFDAAAEGRVETLLVDQQAHPSGSYDPERQELSLDSEPTADSDDLLDLLAWLVLTHGGEVVAVSRDSLQEGSAAAAILRF